MLVLHDSAWFCFSRIDRLRSNQLVTNENDCPSVLECSRTICLTWAFNVDTSFWHWIPKATGILPLVSAPERRLALVKQTWQSITSQLVWLELRLLPLTPTTPNSNSFRQPYKSWNVIASRLPKIELEPNHSVSEKIIQFVPIPPVGSEFWLLPDLLLWHLAFAELAEVGLHPTSQRDRRKGIYWSLCWTSLSLRQRNLENLRLLVFQR